MSGVTLSTCTRGRERGRAAFTHAISNGISIKYISFFLFFCSFLFWVFFYSVFITWRCMFVILLFLFFYFFFDTKIYVRQVIDRLGLSIEYCLNLFFFVYLIWNVDWYYFDIGIILFKLSVSNFIYRNILMIEKNIELNSTQSFYL